MVVVSEPTASVFGHVSVWGYDASIAIIMCSSAARAIYTTYNGCPFWFTGAVQGNLNPNKTEEGLIWILGRSRICAPSSPSDHVVRSRFPRDDFDVYGTLQTLN